MTWRNWLAVSPGEARSIAWARNLTTEPKPPRPCGRPSLTYGISNRNRQIDAMSVNAQTISISKLRDIAAPTNRGVHANWLVLEFAFPIRSNWIVRL